MPFPWSAPLRKMYVMSTTVLLGAVQATTNPAGETPAFGWNNTSPGFHRVPFLEENSSALVRFFPIPQKPFEPLHIIGGVEKSEPHNSLALRLVQGSRGNAGVESVNSSNR